VPRGDSVHGVGVVLYPDAQPGQLVPESYRPGPRCRRRRGQGRDALDQLLRPADQRLPDPVPIRGVERGEDLATAGVEHGQALAGDSGLAEAATDRVERADACHRQAEAGAEAAGAGDADPDPGEGAGAEPDRQQVDAVPPARRRGRALDLLEQRRRVPRPPVGGPQQRLVQSLAVAPGAGSGVGGRGVEADDYRRGAASIP
jgi:hypothetical protein